MNYKDIDITLRRGIKTIIESYGDIESNDSSIEDGIYELIEDTAFEREDVMISFDNICYKFFDKLGFRGKKAKILYKKIGNLNIEDEFEVDYLIELIKEFDLIACCVSQLMLDK